MCINISILNFEYILFLRVIIGAPQAQSTQPGVVRGGAVYYCPADRDDGCRELGFDRSGKNAIYFVLKKKQ